ncbi:MAG: hypothetical protein LBB48_07100 [Treponema sp.]|jgi:hypothetical protein|nr:hypothetical protein [Treponema sp.]
MSKLKFTAIDFKEHSSLNLTGSGDMKKACLFLIMIMPLASFSACRTHPPTDAPDASMADPNTPQWAGELPAADMIWGIGSALDEKQSNAMRAAEKRGKESVGLMLKAYMNDVFKGYGVPREAAENINNKITRAPFDEAAAVLRWKAPNGAWWYRVEYKKADARAFLSGIFDEEEKLFPEFNATRAMLLLDVRIAGEDSPFQTGGEEEQQID